MVGRRVLLGADRGLPRCRALRRMGVIGYWQGEWEQSYAHLSEIETLTDDPIMRCTAHAEIFWTTSSLGSGATRPRMMLPPRSTSPVESTICRRGRSRTQLPRSPGGTPGVTSPSI